MTTEAAYLCPAQGGLHHFHTDKGPQFYVGSSYLGVCCHCGRVQLIVYRGWKETTDLTCIGDSKCGPFYR